MKTQPITRIALHAALLSTLALPVFAQDNNDDEVLSEVTIIGRKMDIADVPGSAHMVGNEEIQQFAAADIMRVLRTVPGVYVQEEEGFGLRPNIGIRGSGLDRSARIALLEDGVLIAPAPYAAPSAYYFPTQRRMHAVEVLKGPSSVAIGPRTTGGAINMISTPVPTENGGNVDFRLGQNGAMDLHTHYGMAGEQLSWLLETVQSGSDGFKHIDGPSGGDTGFDLKDYVAKVRFDGPTDSDWYHSVRLKAGYTDQHSDETYLGLTTEDFGLDPNRRYAATKGDAFDSTHRQLQLSYVIDSRDSWTTVITAYRNEFARNWFKLQSVNGASMSRVLDNPQTYATELGYLQGLDSPDDAIVKRNNNRSYYSEGIQGEVEWNLAFEATDVMLKLGARIHEDEEDRFQDEDRFRMEAMELYLTTDGAPGSNANRVSRAEVRAAYVNTEIRTGDWLLTPGVRFEDISMERLDYSTADPDRLAGPSRVRDNSVSVAIPGMGVLYHLNSQWRLLGGVHKGFNPPAPGSTASEESSVNYEFGTRFDNGDLRVAAIYFANDYDNLVGTVTASTGGSVDIGEQFDGGQVTVQGIELEADYNLDKLIDSRFSLPVSLNYTWTARAEFDNAFESDFEPWGDVQVGDELPYIPEHQVRATVGIEQDRWYANLAANYVGKSRTVAGQGEFLPNLTVDAYTVFDLVAGWRITPTLRTYVKIDNLFDETYIAARRPAGARPGLERTAYVGLALKL
jgi:Fe(3+) dicitrate transport protein